MRASERAMASAAKKLIESMSSAERQRRRLRKKFPGRVVARRGMTADHLIEGFLGDVRGREAIPYTSAINIDPKTGKAAQGVIPPCLVLGSMAYDRDKEPGIKHVAGHIRLELEKLDAKLKRIAARRRKLLAKAWETGVPVTWDEARAVSETAREAR